MARIEKTVFISYRRKDIGWAMAVYQYLTSQKYDVFFDYTSIPSGDFEQIIVGNIRARAHFILILTPTALDRCSEPEDWLRREIETAMDHQRNIIPLFFDDFNFGSPSVGEKLTGRLSTLHRYNGLEIPSGYFIEAMERLSERYLNIPLDAVLHPVSEEVQEVVKKEQAAVNRAVLQKKAIEDRVKKVSFPFGPKVRKTYTVGAAVFAALILAIFGANYLFRTIAERPSGLGSSRVWPKDGMRMNYVPAGDFEMGSNGDQSEAGPVHTVHIDAFWIDQTEITNAMFAVFVKESGYFTDAEKAGSSFVPVGDNKWQKRVGADWGHPLGRDSHISEMMNYPVVHVSWNDARAYCAWADRRLPTEAEWEKASSWDEKEQQKFMYPWGNSIDCSRANYWGAGNGCVGKSAPVGGYERGKSPYGVLDMAGNVAEWVNSLLRRYPYNAVDGREDPDGTGWRVVRGGMWLQAEIYLRTTTRTGQDPAYSDLGLGFRCTRSE